MFTHFPCCEADSSVTEQGIGKNLAPRRAKLQGASFTKLVLHSTTSDLLVTAIYGHAALFVSTKTRLYWSLMIFTSHSFKGGYAFLHLYTWTMLTVHVEPSTIDEMPFLNLGRPSRRVASFYVRRPDSEADMIFAFNSNPQVRFVVLLQ